MPKGSNLEDVFKWNLIQNIISKFCNSRISVDFCNLCYFPILALFLTNMNSCDTCKMHQFSSGLNSCFFSKVIPHCSKWSSRSQKGSKPRVIELQSKQWSIQTEKSRQILTKCTAAFDFH